MLNKNSKILVCLLFLSVALVAQEEFNFERLSANNFPTQSITYAIQQDSIGNVWIASEEGVLKYNSKTIKVYNTYNGLPETVSNRIYSLFVDSQQRVWSGMENGICVLDKSKDVFEIIKSESDQNPTLINEIIEDDNGIIWIGGYNGLWKLDPLSFKVELVLGNINIVALHSVKDTILLGSVSGLSVYNTKSKSLSGIPIINDCSVWHIGSIDSKILVGGADGHIFEIDNSLSEVNEINLENKTHFPITDILKGPDGNIIIGTDGDGLYYLNSSYKTLNHFTENVDNSTSIPSNGVYDLEYNKMTNVLWIATYGGGVGYYNFLKKPFKRIQHIVNDRNSISTNFSRSIETDKEGKIWFGTTKGISIWNPKNNRWKQLVNLSDHPDFKRDIILALENDNEVMWAGTYNNGLFKINTSNYSIQRVSPNKENDIVIAKVYAVEKDNKGQIWVGGVDSDLYKIKNKDIERYPIRQIKSIIQSKSGDIFAAGRYGVFKINPLNKQFSLIEEIKPDKSKLAYATVNSITEFGEHLILGTNGSGLVFFNYENREVKKIDLTSGLPSDIVQGVIIENDHTIWASTTRGLAEIQFTSSDTLINIFDKNDGLASTEFNYGSYKKINDTLLAFGGIEGITIFNPKDIIRSTDKPNLVFDDFKLFNKSLQPGTEPLGQHIDQTKNLRLKSNQNSIEIRFTGILHNSSSKVKYSWMMEGFNDKWSVPSTDNYATFTNLNSGDYRFKVKAFNKYGEAGQERVLEFQILSPWWATNKAILLYILMATGLIFLAVHLTRIMINKKNAEEQIHFFNNITHEIKTPLSILLSSLENVSDKKDQNKQSIGQAKSTIKRINALFEQMLNFHKVTSDNSLSLNVTEIDLADYFNKLVNDFKPLTEEHNLKINIHSESGGELFYHDMEVLDKILHNLLTNSIKYSNDNNKIDIYYEKSKTGHLKIEIVDYGVGIPKDQQKYILKRYYRARNVINSQRPGTGLGLVMVKTLIEKTGGSISFNSIENKGTTFTVSLKNLQSKYIKSNESKALLDNQVLAEIEEQIKFEEYSETKILIVEDNNDLRVSLVNTLGVYFQVFEATNGKEGLEQAASIYPDLIITDLIMPEMDGLEMAKRLKSDISFNHIPIFMLSVLHNSVQQQESIESGVTEYFEKPVNLKLLLAKISNLISWQKTLRKRYTHDLDADNALLFRNKNDQEFLERLENTVIQNIEDNSYSVHELSRSFGMSRTSLYMKLKNLVDLSPQDFIIHTKLKHAKNLLIEGNFNIKEIAYKSGFSNPKYFSTSFKKFYNTTPSSFLDSLKNKS